MHQASTPRAGIRCDCARHHLGHHRRVTRVLGLTELDGGPIRLEPISCGGGGGGNSGDGGGGGGGGSGERGCGGNGGSGDDDGGGGSDFHSTDASSRPLHTHIHEDVRVFR